MRSSPARVLCLGEVAWDLAAAGAARLGEAAAITMTPGGASANTARALVAEGARALVCAALPDDPLGRGLGARLAAEGVDVSLVGPARARAGLVFLEAKGAPGPRAVSYRDLEGEARDLAAHVRACGGAAAMIEHARVDAVVIGTIAGADASTPVFARLARAARRAGAIVAIDVNARPRPWRSLARPERAIALVGLADVVKASVDDLAVIGLDADALARRLRRGATLVVTDGSGPARAMNASSRLEAAPPRAFPSDAPGAGDAFVAGLVIARLEGADAPTCLAAGHACAARWLARAPR